MKWLEILQNVIQTLLTVFITFLVFWLAGIVKKKFGKTMSEKYLNAALMAVKITEQLTRTSGTSVNGPGKKTMAIGIAKEILAKENEKNIDEDMLSNIIEASVYEIKGKKNET